MSKDRDDYEFADEYESKSDELNGVSLEDYNESRCAEEYGMTNEEMDSGDDD